ncbi:hypothetical protein DB346_22020 [Verrucomicrobia bacterium LW23]|nr:hypothetical protein DB346_22020 [Verrucomicrobia bacterium LW23]
MMESVQRIFALARITLLEAMRQKVLNILILFAVIAVGTSLYFSTLKSDEQIKFLLDFCFGAMTVFGLFIALISTAYMIPNELENRTIYTILAKPVRRSEFIVGKYLGVVALLGVVTLLMSIVFLIVLNVQAQINIASYTQLVEQEGVPELDKRQLITTNTNTVLAQAQDPMILQGILLVYARLCIVAAMAMVISTITTSAIFTVCTTFMFYVIGHMQGYARDVVMDPTEQYGPIQKALLSCIAALIPNMRSFSAIDEMVLGTKVTWDMTFGLLGYSAFYITCAIALASLLFSEREL